MVVFWALTNAPKNSSRLERPKKWSNVVLCVCVCIRLVSALNLCVLCVIWVPLFSLPLFFGMFVVDGLGWLVGCCGQDWLALQSSCSCFFSFLSFCSLFLEMSTQPSSSSNQQWMWQVFFDILTLLLLTAFSNFICVFLFEVTGKELERDLPCLTWSQRGEEISR